ncbi:MAG: cysteine synthase family protein [Thaumarchaeota archaeon]|nr:cysteine synthase family protein [Nitrososphaerota archaeon]
MRPVNSGFEKQAGRGGSEISLLRSIGNTPLISLVPNSSSNGKIFAKAEFLNPTGSVKDRAGAKMLETAIQNDGILDLKRDILDSSSGNTGISLAAFGASLGLRVSIVLPESASIERQKLLRLYGASIIFSDPMEGSDGAIRVARDLVEKSPEKYYYTDQYSNEANWQAHFFGTAEEIWNQTSRKITHLVAGVGTGGTIMGTGKRLKELNPEIQIIAVEPDGPFHGIEGLKHIESSIKPKIFDETFPDETVFIKTEDAQKMVLKLAKEQGLFVGTSSGAAYSACQRFTTSGNMVVGIFADQGSRYLSEKYLQVGAP